MKIAFIGTGVMGTPMVRNLSKNNDILVYNRSKNKTIALENCAVVCDSIQDLVKNCDLVITIVGFPSDVKEVYKEVFKYAKKGTILMDMTTSSPTLAKELYKEAKEEGLYMLDAPVTGGDIGAINATLSIMVGGDKEVYESVLPVLNDLGKTINYMGKPGNGQYMKLANQIAICGSLVAAAESLSFAIEKGLDLSTALDVIGGGSASSWQAINNGRKMVKNDYNPGFYIKHFIKDLRLAIEESDKGLVITKKVVQMYELLIEKDYEQLGTQAIIDYYLKYNR